MNNKMVQSSSVMFNDSLMSTDDALTLLFDSAIVSTQTEISSLDSSIGRILAKDIHSKIMCLDSTIAPWMAIQLH